MTQGPLPELWENLTQSGGDRYAAAGPIIDAIKTALGEGAAENEIREAFGLGRWRVVTAAHRERYGEYFARRTYSAIVDAMRDGLARDNVLNIRGFAKFSTAQARGELFPISDDAGPCIAADMRLVDVTIASGVDDCDGGAPSGIMTGEWGEWAGNNKIIHHYADWAWVYAPQHIEDMTPQGLGLAAVRGRLRLILDYGGLAVQEMTVVSGLLVWGRKVLGGRDQHFNSDRWDLEIVNGSPPIQGMIDSSVWGGGTNYGPYYSVSFANEPMYLGCLYSAAHIAQWIGRSAHSVLSSSDVHKLSWGDKTIPAAGWASCFPRKKWVVRTEYYDGHLQLVDRWVPVKWITRENWMERFGDDLSMYSDIGAVIPEELVSQGGKKQKYYASWDASFINDLNAE